MPQLNPYHYDTAHFLSRDSLSTMIINRRRFVASMGVAITAALARNQPLAAAPVSGVARRKVLFDTDIGNDIDDAIALSYLLAHPHCDLLGITTVTGEPEKRAELASALCHLAGRPDIPIFPGAARPLVVAQLQPEAEQHAALGSLPRQTDFGQGEAIEFLRKTIRAHPGEVTLLAVGPMTNLGLLFRADPEIPGLLRELVVMCGKFDPKPFSWGHAEWNARLDPEATAIVYDSAPPIFRSYGLDVTFKVSLPGPEFFRRFAEHPRLKPVVDFARVTHADKKEIVFHDPLAAVSLFVPEICGMERGRVTIELKDGPDKGRTVWTPDATGPCEVAFTVDAEKFFKSYFEVF